MLLRDPQPDPDFKRKFNEFETEIEHPAISKSSSYSGIAGTHPNWHDSLPQIRKPDYPPSWDKPAKKPIDFEKLVGRAFIVAGFVMMLFLGSIYIVKLIQFSLAVSLK